MLLADNASESRGAVPLVDGVHHLIDSIRHAAKVTTTPQIQAGTTGWRLASSWFAMRRQRGQGRGPMAATLDNRFRTERAPVTQQGGNHGATHLALKHVLE